MELAAASSECSSGCQSGWTTYLDDDGHSSSSSSSGTAPRFFHAKQHCCDNDHHHHYYYYSEEDDLSMISDASSGPRQQCSAGNDVVQAERRGRRVADAASARRQQSKKAAAASAALLEDTASSPAFFAYSKATSLLEANGYGDEPTMMEIGNAADFSCAFSATTTTTGFKSPLHGTALDGYLQMHYSSAADNKPMMPTRQVCRDAGETTKMW
ncbi:hypothetical protein QOZ80_3BG0290560 [Eleusine coracana subsp. coracana]|nr:hypothetical protein QOZ80_3BG0290560 [Eleusine coracana subsp. coracana]